MMKSKKWVDMDADELIKEGKSFKWVTILNLIIALISFIHTMYNPILLSAFICVAFLLLGLFYMNVKFHLDTLSVIKNPGVR